MTEGFTQVLAVAFPLHGSNRAAVYHGHLDGSPCWALVQLTAKASRQIETTTVPDTANQWLQDLNQFVADGVATLA